MALKYTVSLHAYFLLIHHHRFEDPSHCILARRYSSLASLFVPEMHARLDPALLWELDCDGMVCTHQMIQTNPGNQHLLLQYLTMLDCAGHIISNAGFGNHITNTNMQI